MNEKKWYLCTSGSECLYFVVQLSQEEYNGVKKFCEAKDNKENIIMGECVDGAIIDSFGFSARKDAEDEFVGGRNIYAREK